MMDWMEFLGYPMPGEVLAWILIFVISFLVVLQAYMWTTGSRTVWIGILVSLIAGIGALALVTREFSMVPTVWTACIYNVYGWTGYIYIGSVIALAVTMAYNALGSWRGGELEVLQ
jgi:hypothetical protein